MRLFNQFCLTALFLCPFALLGGVEAYDAKSVDTSKESPLVEKSWCETLAPLENPDRYSWVDLPARERLRRERIGRPTGHQDSYECAAHTSVNLEPIVEDARTKAPLSGNGYAVSRYD
jgi:hypothetical protein